MSPVLLVIAAGVALIVALAAGFWWLDKRRGGER